MAEDRGPHQSGSSAKDRIDEMVDEAGRESFPASDPPATWSGGDWGGRRDQKAAEA